MALGVGGAERERVKLADSVAERVRVALVDGDELPDREVDEVTDGDTGLRVTLGVQLAERDREVLAEPDFDPDGLADELAEGVGGAEHERVELADSVVERVCVAIFEEEMLPEREADARGDADAVAEALRDADRDGENSIDGLALTVSDMDGCAHAPARSSSASNQRRVIGAATRWAELGEGGPVKRGGTQRGRFQRAGKIQSSSAVAPKDTRRCLTDGGKRTTWLEGGGGGTERAGSAQRGACSASVCVTVCVTLTHTHTTHTHTHYCVCGSHLAAWCQATVCV